jgi:hypothetical protein
MSTASFGAGLVGGAATMLTRRATRRALYRRTGEPRLPPAARRREGFGAMLAWAVAAGVILALADVLLEQRSHMSRRP